MATILVTPPATEPITLAEARLHLKEDTVGADIDEKIMGVVKAVRQLCENNCRRAFIEQQWKLVLPSFAKPGMNVASATWYGPQWGTAPGPLAGLGPNGTTGYELYIPFPPLQSVDKIEYVDSNGVAQTMDPVSDLIINFEEEPAVIMPAFNTTWPDTRTQQKAVSITFTCGYGPDPADVPACAKQWMLTMLGAVYEMPQAEFAAYRETLLVPKFVDRLLDPIRVQRY